ncbi:hypothetical protein ACTJJ0_30275 [Chitinophaga sp. 22321]|uniref:Flippase GtrA (Transmembrane translocase of bactoprenol-linked glucose) n=1 Tax=Chitinophaga hostae TaxID=2831022 RepID=A0ABS5J827_9BACT|nr:hypothetical protein [Chitinophaga hostae]MBS0031335.1 hypothetical protein [Chitinophaga hostae]
MDPLKAAWDNIPTPSRSTADIQAMAVKQTSPVIKQIRKQLIIEAIGYTLFLVVYYDFFDGDKKPFYLNALLVISVIFMLVYNVAGYMMAKQPSTGSNLLQTMQQQLRQLKRYAAVAVTSRVLAFAGIFAFFLANIHWNNHKYLAVVLIAAAVFIQQFYLRKIWAGRLNRFSNIITELKG